jgi:hypothetical protein
VRARVEAKWAALQACLSATPTCDVSTVADYYTGVALTERLASINDFNARGLTFRNVDRYRIRVLEVTFYEANTKAVVRVCVDDRMMQVQPNANSDGSDIILNDEEISSIIDWEMIREDDGQWRQYFGDTIDETINAEPVCDIDG